ncbi:Spaf_1101 family AAA-like ATPase [Clostridium botulinum]|uniref:Spaf_1101 family AAA-like ATPase n=1 Tax=Clostridium botulinum TaxID=1491 RepID=UPI0009474790|nr:AAA family ATPase [Clostridium botulinum]APQ98077.1 PHP domain protein [Clostridium botulinum]MBN3361711.1 hypothetical protein [Clostridium botulinum]
MNKKIIKELYEKILKKKKGCKYYKIDLHIHTLASKCYTSSFDNIKDEYIRILDEALENEIRIIAITDHNTVKGYYELMNILSEDKSLRDKYKKILILPGIEISNFGKHILAIFPKDKTENELGTFLYNIGIEHSEQGDEDSDAYKITPLELLRKINENGGLAILAHADATNGMLEKLLHSTKKGKDISSELWIQKGKSLASIIRSEYLMGISINDSSLKEKLLKDILNNKQYRRDKSIPIVYFSDSHSATIDKKHKGDGKAIGERFSIIKLSELSFHGLRIAFQDPEVRIYDEIPINEYPYVEGAAVCGGYIGTGTSEFQCFRFNEALNCIIGARGTGKSTLLNIIQYTLFPYDNNDDVVSRFDLSVVYLNYKGEIYAFVCEPKLVIDEYTEELINYKKEPTIYKLSRSGNFYKNDTGQLMYKELKSFSSVAYKQRDIFNYAQDEKGPIELINNLIMISNKEKYITLLKEIKTEKDLLMDNIKSISKSGHKNYLEYWNEDEEDEIEEVIEPFIEILKLYNELHKLRQDIISKINNVLEDQVKLSIIKIFSRSNLISIIDDTIGRCRRKFNITYEKQRWLRKQLERIIIISQTINEWQFPIAVLNNDENYIAQTFKIEIKDANELLRYIRPVFNIWTLAKWPMDTIGFQYNTNNGINNKKRFMDSKKLSMGQKSVAMLLIILTAAYDLGDNRPLIIDQPEDDLDNIYIYSSLVKEFRKIKNSRQLIFATHNANIPISGDAENIIILESNGDNGFVKITGSIDKVSISEKVLNILEGGRQALDLRNSKYPPFIT